MAVPPPFNPAAPPKPKSDSSKACLIAVIVVVAFCVVLGVGGFFMANGVWNNAIKPMASCMVTFDTARDAMLAYAKKNDGKLPPATKWQAAIKPYYERISAKLDSQELPAGMGPDPIGGTLDCEFGSSKTGIAYNSAIAGMKLADIKDKSSTALLFEVANPGMDLVAKYDPNRSEKPPKFMMNDREWTVFFVEGNSEPFENSNAELNIETSPADGLPAKGPGN